LSRHRGLAPSFVFIVCQLRKSSTSIEEEKRAKVSIRAWFLISIRRDHKESFQRAMIMNYVERDITYSENGDIAQSKKPSFFLLCHSLKCLFYDTELSLLQPGQLLNELLRQRLEALPCLCVECVAESISQICLEALPCGWDVSTVGTKSRKREENAAGCISFERRKR